MVSLGLGVSLSNVALAASGTPVEGPVEGDPEAEVAAAIAAAGGIYYNFSSATLTEELDGTGAAPDVDDVIGNVNGIAAESYAARGILRADGAKRYMETDGVNVSYPISTPSILTLSSNMTCIHHMRSSDLRGRLLSRTDGGPTGYAGFVRSDNTTTTLDLNVGSPEYLRNTTVLPSGITRQQLQAEYCVGNWVNAVINNIDLLSGGGTVWNFYESASSVSNNLIFDSAAAALYDRSAVSDADNEKILSYFASLL